MGKSDLEVVRESSNTDSFSQEDIRRPPDTPFSGGFEEEEEEEEGGDTGPYLLEDKDKMKVFNDILGESDFKGKVIQI